MCVCAHVCVLQFGWVRVMSSQIGASFAGSAYFGAGQGQIVLDDVRCRGNETRLVDCSNGVPNCQHSEDVGVTCQGEPEPVGVMLLLKRRRRGRERRGCSFTMMGLQASRV